MMPLIVLSTWWVQGQKVSFSLLPELLYLELKGGGSIVLFNTYNIVLCYHNCFGFLTSHGKIETLWET